MVPKTDEQNEKIRQETRKKIREAAFPLFAEKGYTNTTISAIAQKAEVSKGLIYHYFDNKEQILISIFQFWMDSVAYMMDFPDKMAPEQKMEQMLSSVFEFTKQKTEVTRLFTALALQSEAIEAVKMYLNQIMIRQFEIMIALMDELGYENPEEEAYYLGAQMDGVSLGYLTLGDEYPWETITNKIMKKYVPDKKS